jgi:hypothetical protein
MVRTRYCPAVLRAPGPRTAEIHAGGQVTSLVDEWMLLVTAIERRS